MTYLSADILNVMLISLLTQIIFIFIYFIVPVIAFQATPGMHIFKIKLVTEKGHRKVNSILIIIRFLLTYFSGAILMIGYVMMVLTKKEQALHDLLTRTVVINQ